MRPNDQERDSTTGNNQMHFYASGNQNEQWWCMKVFKLKRTLKPRFGLPGYKSLSIKVMPKQGPRGI